MDSVKLFLMCCAVKGCFRMLWVVFKIFTYVHIVFVSSSCVVGFLCFQLFSFVGSGVSLSQVVVGCCVLVVFEVVNVLEVVFQAVHVVQFVC